MSKTNFEMIMEFRKAFGFNTPKHGFAWPDQKNQELNIALIEEEFKEYREAVSSRNSIEVIDALADLLYVVYAAASSHGINIDGAYREVHRSNMTKLDRFGKPIYDSNGKVVKSELFEEPKLEKFLWDELGW